MTITAFYYVCDECSTLKVISPDIAKTMSSFFGTVGAQHARYPCTCQIQNGEGIYFTDHGLLKVEEIFYKD